MRKYISKIVTVAVLAIAFFAISNKQYLRDLYTVNSRSVSPSADLIKGQLSLTKKADFIYHASLPEVQDADSFNQSCRGVNREQSIVLGCYTAQRFYIFNVDDPRLAGVKEVTAAHELLHAVYERMPKSEKTKLDNELFAQAAKITDERFIQTLDQYKKTEPDQIANELHSILGTEISNLSPELEQHYKKYFKNRATIVGFADQYAGTFKSLDEQIKSYDDQLKKLKTKIDSSETLLDTQKNSVTNFQNNLASLKARDEIAQYNSLVVSYNRLVVIYNSNIENLKQNIATYNEMIEKRNSVATVQNDLSQHLNSNFKPVE